MARPHKKGVDYFSFDVNFFTFDKRIKLLRARYGSDGIVVYIYLLTEIYKDQGYFLRVDNDFNYVISDELKMSPEKIGQIINFLLERSLFDNTLFKSDKVLTSHGIQLRFQEAVSKRSSVEVDGKYWLLGADETKGFIKCTQNEGLRGENGNKLPENGGFSGENDTKESKGNNKDKEIKEDIFGDFCGDDKELRTAFADFEEMRNKKLKKPLTDKARQLLITELCKITTDRNMQIAVLDQSTLKCWLSVYKLKSDNQPEKNSVKGTSFSNFKEGEADFEDLEKKQIEKLMNRQKGEANGP